MTITYRAFNKQIAFHQSPARIRGAFAGKRGGKTECGAVEGIRFTDGLIGKKPGEIDTYQGAIIAPTTDMLRRLSLKKFLAYSQGFYTKHNLSTNEVTWHNGAEIYGISGEKPKRIEGLKLKWAWIDEVFQVSEQLFLEVLARVSDSQGFVWVTGSLGVQYTNPKAHWAYKYFKLKPLDGAEAFEWTTADNPFFPREELYRLKDTLDPRTFRQMFELSWDIPGTNLVYDDFTDENVLKENPYDSRLPVYVAVDWGFAHPAAVGFFQFDPRTKTVYMFDEIVQSRLQREQLYEKIMDRINRRNMKVAEWYCDIAGLQERELADLSNVKWFKAPPRNIHFKFRTSAVNQGIPIVRSYIKNGAGQRRFYVYEANCPKTIDGLRNYAYPEKDGMILNENPVKKDDDACDMVRYFFINRLDPNRVNKTFQEIERGGL